MIGNDDAGKETFKQQIIPKAQCSDGYGSLEALRVTGDREN